MSLTFDQLGLIEPIQKAVQQEGYTVPTPIQQQTIPIALEGRDVLGCAQTGSGKTLAFAIPILQQLHNRPNEFRKVRTLILTPTRELAIQIGESFTAYGRNTRVKHTVIFGGVPQGSQVAAVKGGLDVLIATPGRLLDLMQQGFVRLDGIEIFVLDEADRMLDMGFIHEVKRIIAKLPNKKQTLFFSATMPKEIQGLADSLLHNPAKVAVDPVSSTVDTIEQKVFHVTKADKRHLLVHLLKDANVETALIFTRTKHGADRVAKDLNKAGVPAEAIHGNKSQNARQRALSNFKERRTRVLVATDIAARGIDIDLLSHVINFDLPEVPETYVHRIGRTGRAGASGIAFSFCDPEEKTYLRDIHNVIRRNIPVVNDHPFIGNVGAPPPRAENLLEKWEKGEVQLEQASQPGQRAQRGQHSGGNRSGGGGQRRPGQSSGGGNRRSFGGGGRSPRPSGSGGGRSSQGGAQS